MAETDRKNLDLDILGYYDGKIKNYVDNKAGTGGLTIDTELSDTSENPVQNKTIKQELDKKVNAADVQDNLESTDTTSPLSANQGKVLNEKIAEHTGDSDIHVTVSDKENWNSHPNDVTASGYHVLLDDLQGGVPFSDLAVSSVSSESSIIGQTFSFKVYGKNILYTKSDYSTVRCSSSVPSDNEDAFVLTPLDYTLTSVAYRAKKPLYLKNGESITVKGSYENPNGNTINIRILANNYVVATTGNITDASGDFELTFTAKRDYYDPINAPDDDIEILFYARVNGTTAYGPVTYKNVQIEHGDTATDYERAGYTYLSITPDSDPYIIPNEIIQHDGINNIYCNSGNVVVNAVRANLAIKKIWDKMGMDLLFDGVTSANNPAVIDLANYKFVEIHHIMIANEKTYPVNIRLSLDSYLSSASTITTPMSNSTINTIHTEEGTVSSLYAISEAGSNMNNTKIYGIK